MKRISLIFLVLNIFILVFVPIIFVQIFNFYPNLDSSENGLGVYPLLAILYGTVGLMVTLPFALIMLILNAWFNRNK